MDTATTTPQDVSAESAGPAVAGLVDAVHKRVTGILDLALAEARLAAASLWLMAFSVLLAASCVLGAWGLALAGFVSGLAALGAPLWALLLALAALHAAGAVMLWRLGLALGERMLFSATRQQLRRTKDH